MGWICKAWSDEGDPSQDEVHWRVYLVGPKGEEEDIAAGRFQVGTDPDGDAFTEAVAEGENEADRRNGLESQDETDS